MIIHLCSGDIIIESYFVEARIGDHFSDSLLFLPQNPVTIDSLKLDFLNEDNEIETATKAVAPMTYLPGNSYLFEADFEIRRDSDSISEIPDPGIGDSGPSDLET